MSDKQVEAERKRGDYFRDVLVEMYGCPPLDKRPLCTYAGCPFMDDDEDVDHAECWDVVKVAEKAERKVWHEAFFPFCRPFSDELHEPDCPLGVLTDEEAG